MDVSVCVRVGGGTCEMLDVCGGKSKVDVSGKKDGGEGTDCSVSWVMSTSTSLGCVPIGKFISRLLISGVGGRGGLNMWGS